MSNHPGTGTTGPRTVAWRTAAHRTPVSALTGLIALVTMVTAVSGVLGPATAYPTTPLREAFAPNDAVTLALGLPVLAAAVWLTRRARPAGLLLWPGALCFLLYNCVAYLVALPLGWRWSAQLAAAALCLITIPALVGRVDAAATLRGFADRVPVRTTAGILAGLGALFLVRAAVILAGVVTGGQQATPAEVGTAVADLLITPTWVACGVLLWRRRPAGFAVALGVLGQASMLFVGLVAFLLLQPALTSVALVPSAVVVVAVMALPCLVPFALFLRAALTPGRPDSPVGPAAPPR